MEDQGSSTEYYPVHTGLWTNWSRGSIFGPTLTLKRQDADLLIAFTAFFIAIVSSRVWRIICFAFHRHYATPTQQGVMYHQCQAILRNSSNAENGIQLLTRVLWNNRSKKGRVRLATTVIVAGLCIAAFSAAGGFSSQISTSAGTEVLIKSVNCGHDRADFHSDDGALPYLPIVAEAINNAANYAQQCYSSSTGILNCGRFVTKSIASDIDTQAKCPFSNGICRLKSENLRVDSGFINSHDHLGLNSPPDERMLARNILHCAPMKTEGFSSQLSTNFGNITLYHYGSMQSGGEVVDYMTTASSLSSQYSYVLSMEAVDSYENYHMDTTAVQFKDGEINTGNSDFIPIDLISRNDADLHIILLSGNGVLFTAPSNDEWYRVSPTATELFLSNANTSDSASESDQVYLPLEPGSPLGCAQQYQFCRKDTRSCGPLASFHDAVTGAAPFFNTTHDDAIKCVANTTIAANFAYLINTIGANSYATLSNIVTQLGPASLASQSTKIQNLQGRLPSNQWQLDVIRWSDIFKASLQAGFLSTAYFNPANSSLLGVRTNFEAPEFLMLCNNQKIRSTSYGSFSLFGLLFTFILGFLIISTSYLLEPISKFLYNRWGYKEYAHLEWTTNATLQLQRLAHEELGFGTWSKGTDEVPATKNGELLACLDITNPIHPVLGSPSKDVIASEETQTPLETQISRENQVLPETEVTHETSMTASERECERMDEAPSPGTSCDESRSNICLERAVLQDGQPVSPTDSNGTETGAISRSYCLANEEDTFSRHTVERSQR
ncbi:hypothetical protein O1611_g602 [Lasiodiplodia mahajangana]|uniref:Uncharacterized protein n=1 Tax=Lasiodiplodia mahajangana TaxID=1108764 RepID=A0ACC2K041_9PEZI|nr:hypothetical protein O1611_g602 [Lasiodiplodia mahajangana]